MLRKTLKTITLITCNDLFDAYIIMGKLKNEGIHCFLTNENFTGLVPMFNNTLGSGVQIIIQENDLGKARNIIKDKLEPDNKNLSCPHCGSKEIGLGLGKSKGIKIINILIALLMTLPFGNLKPKYYCKKCNKEIK